MENWTRRNFILATVAGGMAARTKRHFEGAAAEGVASGAQGGGGSAKPLILSSANGYAHLAGGMEALQSGGDALDAVLTVVTKVEDDPNDDSVGFGGLPNEDGVVQLDACVMHGPTGKCGAVGAIETIKNPSLVARAVMEKTNHTFLVGAGATKFAADEGFEPVNLLTERSRLAWLAWRAKTTENWRPGLDSPQWKAQLNGLLDTPEKLAWKGHIESVVENPPTGTINCLALDTKGNVSGTTTTSGLAWKISGRVGDSPLIGAGLFVDNEVGAAGSTGRGEENIKIAGGHTIVEMMRRGMSPTDACLEALHRVAGNYKAFPERLKNFRIQFYAINKDGKYGAGSLWAISAVTGKTIQYAVNDGTGAKLLPCTPLFDKAGGDY